MNQALRSAMLAAGLEHLDLASHLSVDPKTVERWLAGRLPHPRNRAAIAKLVGRTADELWPSTSDANRRGRLGSEVRAVYPHRWAVPREMWFSLFERAQCEISILVYSGLFLAEDAGIVRLLGDKAQAGTSVRILLGDPESGEVVQRGDDEGIGESMAARIRNALKLVRPLVGVEGAQLRLHSTALYNSIYRADDEFFVNPHIYGIPAANAPVMHLHRSDDNAMASVYLDSFERVWATARDVSA